MNIKTMEGKNAFDLFPELFRNAINEKKNTLLIPPPPDLSWLDDGMTGRDTTKPNNSLTALVALIEVRERVIVEKVLVEMGYAIHISQSVSQAMQRLHEDQYNLIICGVDAAFKDIHQYICSFPSTKRRVTYYTIVGPNLHTLYNLEALALSANLVVNNKDLEYLKKVLHKGFGDYEKLFRPLLDILSVKVSSF